MKKIALAALLAASFGLAHADVITFEGVATSAQLAAGYGGLDWSNFYGLNVTPANYSHSGYMNALESGSYVAFNAGGGRATILAPSASGFDLTSGYFTAAWNNGLSVTAAATFENGTTATKTFVLTTQSATDEFFDWTDLAAVRFTSTGGTLQSGFSGQGTQFAIDNLDTTPAVPEPTNVALLLAGVGLLGLVARRRSI